MQQQSYAPSEQRGVRSQFHDDVMCRRFQHKAMHLMECYAVLRRRGAIKFGWCLHINYFAKNSPKHRNTQKTRLSNKTMNCIRCVLIGITNIVNLLFLVNPTAPTLY